MMPNRHTSHQSSRFQRWLKPFMKGVFRSLWWFSGRRRRETARAGFVFPTTLLLILMVLLTASALTFRTFSRSSQVISQREQQVIYNAATPAIDRAKAKLEFLFTQDTRLIGVPSSDYLANMMLPWDAAFTNRIPGPSQDIDALNGLADPYTLPDERRLNINDDPRLDNAWAFPADVNGDGVIDEQNGEPTEWAAYSILVDHEGPLDGDAVTVRDKADDVKANALVTRTGPLATTQASDTCASPAVVEEGWERVDTITSSDIQKNFQITAFVSNNRGNNVGQTFESLEFQQSRIASSANKWGAWFRYDLDIFPGQDFKWNGAMHTDGSLIVENRLQSYMLTSHNSCLYSDTSSEITLGEISYDDDGDRVPDVTFQGQAIKGTIKNNSYAGRNVEFHLFNGDRVPPTLGTNLTNGNHSVDGGAPADVAMNPITLFLRDRSEHVNQASWQRDADWKDQPFVTTGRIRNAPEDRPFVDDFYRADNRWGPKPRYDISKQNLSLENDPDDPNDDRSVGEAIDNALTDLTEAETGLDGYWERQAIKSGLRLIVGERLELGNMHGWGNDPSGVANAASAGDPMYPALAPVNSTAANNLVTSNNLPGTHEYRQHRSLRDNLAAVQGMVVYHYEGPGDMATNGKFPAACVALTAHPGTEQSILNSRRFEESLATVDQAKVDFLRGKGTNGWEFEFPDAFNTETEFAAQIGATNPLGIALRNLAYFAGDIRGGAPSFPPVQDGDIHPYPMNKMWGDYSTLRRVLNNVDAGTAYGDLSYADQSTLHSAACTVSLLAYSLTNSAAESNDIIGNSNIQGFLTSNGQKVSRLIDGTKNGGNSEITDIYYTQTFDDGSRNPFYDTSKGTTMAQVYANWVDDNPDSIVIDFDATDLNNNGVLDAAEPKVYICHPTDPSAAVIDDAGYDPDCDVGEFAASFTFEEWVAAFRLALGEDDAAVLEDALRSISSGFTSLRDRALGFSDAVFPSALLSGDGSIGYDPDSQYSIKTNIGVSGTSVNNAPVAFKSACNPDAVLGALGGGGGGASARDAIVLSVALCGEKLPVRYPSLYYLFPLEDHDFDGSVAVDTRYGSYDHSQPGGASYAGLQDDEEYIIDPYIIAENGRIATEPTGVENPYTSNKEKPFRVLNTTDPTDVSAIAAVPASMTDIGSWVLPATTANAALTDPNSPAEAFRITLVNQNGNESGVNVPFLDKGLFNGREQMAVRVLDIDIDALVDPTRLAVTDYWLPSRADDPNDADDFATEGIIYAVREDAVREDEIVRPANNAATNCAGLNGTDFRIVAEANCRMNVLPGTTVQDPPLQANNVSIKPVDFAADPDRRPHGFRFRASSGNPVDFSGGDPTDADNSRRDGMTFVSDNTAYIQGDFNLHSSDGSRNNFLEEFLYTLQDKNFGPNDFYNRRTVAGPGGLNTDDFADLSVDHWRPTEILVDGLTVLSADFPDGAIEDAFVDNNRRDSSFAALNRPRDNGPWLRENPADDTTPIWVDRNGTFYLENAAGNWDEYYDVLTADGDLITMEEENDREANLHNAQDTYVNATFVSGIVPERPNEAYGGLHNYPRFLEEWDRNGSALFISGSFIQLNFSTSATAPYDQQAWEPGTNPTAAEWIYYYTAPERRWGFDVGLLYNPAAPAARRFSQLGRSRSEYYRELPSDDPYISNLRCAKYAETAGGAPNTELFPDFCNNN